MDDPLTFIQQVYQRNNAGEGLDDADGCKSRADCSRLRLRQACDRSISLPVASPTLLFLRQLLLLIQTPSLASLGAFGRPTNIRRGLALDQ